MPNVETDDSREERIDLEIVVDAYNEEERAMGWYYYLDEHLNFPFKAIWINHKNTSLLTTEKVNGEKVEVIGMSSEEECSKEMFVEVLYKEGTVEDSFSVPLYDIEPLDADPKTQEAIADWHYWVDQKYQF